MADIKKNIILEDKKRWEMAMGITNMGFYDWYPLEDKIVWDKTIHKITGLSTRSKKRRQEYFVSIIHPEDVEKVVHDMTRLLDPESSENEFKNQFRSIVKGNIKYIRTTGYRELDNSGNVSRVFGIVMDMTSEFEAETRIRINEERLRTAAAATGFGTFDFLVPENNVFWDKRMHEIFGLKESSKAFRNDVFFSRIHPDDKDRIAANFAERMGPEGTDNSAYDEFRIIVNNKVKYLNSYGIIVRDAQGNVIRATGTIIDVSNQKKIEKELRESQEYFRSVFEGTSDNIFTINDKRKVVFINQVAPGLSKEEVVGTPILDLVISEEKENVKKALDKVFYKAKIEKYETTFQGPNGDIYFYTQVSPLIDNGKVYGATFISRDITSLKTSEQKLRKQAIELQRTNQNLEQFAYVSSHDIKAPVTNLESLLSIMEEQNVVRKEGKPIFDRLKITVGQMNRTIRSLNEVFSVQSNLNLPKEKVLLDKTLQEVLESIDTQVMESGAKVYSDFKNASYIRFPEIHLKSILQNLITNSIKYRLDGITPKIRIRSRQIKSTKKIQLTVTDNGRGIDLEKYSTKVFGLFQRFHLDTEGKGMGLYIIKLILESYGGKISVTSKPNKGTKFTLIF